MRPVNLERITDSGAQLCDRGDNGQVSINVRKRHIYWRRGYNLSCSIGEPTVYPKCPRQALEVQRPDQIKLLRGSRLEFTDPPFNLPIKVTLSRHEWVIDQ